MPLNSGAGRLQVPELIRTHREELRRIWWTRELPGYLYRTPLGVEDSIDFSNP